MKVLIIGSGAREHALVRAMSADPLVTELVVAPGNAGIAADATVVPVDVADPIAVADLAQEQDADLVVIGPELPLVNGAADEVRTRGIDCFGPSGAAAQLEGSKAFAKDVMAAAGVPTAASRKCVNQEEVEHALAEFGAPYVVKDDGLAGGKGVVVTDARVAALEHAEVCLAQGHDVVVEEYLDGPEVSLFVVTDGFHAVPLLPAQDFKRLGDADQGPNTGGMGAYTPLPWADEHLVADIMAEVVRPTLAEMADRGTPFLGVLYCGLALTSQGLRVVEFNARFGDPEIQAVLALLDSPLGVMLQAAARGTLADLPAPTWMPGAAVNVVVASAGYPKRPETGDPITGLAGANREIGVHVLHAGTAFAETPDEVEAVVEDTTAQYVSAGGRVLSVVGLAADVPAARDAAYRGVAHVNLTGSQHRTDIAGGI
ncbi:MAG: phosphoribosylamine--glycine ligase [Actinomycetia bacterium]|nr:phosphoribosylamine--glycine ligase [Actinomycetes bacterium]